MSLWGRGKGKQKVKEPDSNLMTAKEFVAQVKEKELNYLISVKGVLLSTLCVEGIGDRVFFNSGEWGLGIRSATYCRDDISMWPITADDIKTPPDWVEHIWQVAKAFREIGQVIDTVSRTVPLLESGQPLTFMKDIHQCYRVVVRFFPDHSWIDIGWKGPLIVADNDDNHSEAAGIIPASTKVYTTEHVLDEYSDKVDQIGNLIPDSFEPMAELRAELQKLRELITGAIAGDDLLDPNPTN